MVCKECGSKERITIYDRDEAIRRNIRLDVPRCKRCGSVNVRLID